MQFTASGQYVQDAPDLIVYQRDVSGVICTQAPDIGGVHRGAIVGGVERAPQQPTHVFVSGQSRSRRRCIGCVIEARVRLRRIPWLVGSAEADPAKPRLVRRWDGLEILRRAAADVHVVIVLQAERRWPGDEALCVAVVKVGPIVLPNPPFAPRLRHIAQDDRAQMRTCGLIYRLQPIFVHELDAIAEVALVGMQMRLSEDARPVPVPLDCFHPREIVRIQRGSHVFLNAQFVGV